MLETQSYPSMNLIQPFLFNSWIDFRNTYWSQSELLWVNLSQSEWVQNSHTLKHLHFKPPNVKTNKEIEFLPQLKWSNSYIVATWWYKHLVFQTKSCLSNRIHSLKYWRSTTSGCIEILKARVFGKNSFPFKALYRLNILTP